MTSSQEFAIENMKDKGSQIDRQTGRRRKTLKRFAGFFGLEQKEKCSYWVFR